MAALSLSVTAVKAQNNHIETTISADFVSQYIWRGQDLGNVSLQPTLGVGYKGLSLSAWGNIGISNPSDTKEFDLTIGYTIGGFNIGITDYWFSTGGDPEGRYFKYDAHCTNHIFEANVGYDFGVVNFQWFTNFAGNDTRTQKGKRAYSSYFELNVPFRLGSLDWNASIGCVPYATEFYATTGFAVTNLSLKATKDITVTDKFSIPIFAGLTANPNSKKAYFILGITLQP
jgi:hypothetical protein